MAWIVPIVTAAASYISAHKAQKQNAAAQGQMQPLIDEQTKAAQALYPYISKYLGAGWNAVQQPLGYYSSLASGNRNLMLGALSPELSSIDQKYATLGNATREFAPRSGANATYNTDLAYRAGDEKQNLINQARAGAMGSLASLGSGLASTGLSAAGQAGNASTMGLNGILGKYNLGRQGAADQSNAYGQIAQALGGLYTNYQNGDFDWMKNFGGGGGAGAGSTGPGTGNASDYPNFAPQYNFDWVNH